jgi:hypothetical protein
VLDGMMSPPGHDAEIKLRAPEASEDTSATVRLTPPKKSTPTTVAPFSTVISISVA